MLNDMRKTIFRNGTEGFWLSEESDTDLFQEISKMLEQEINIKWHKKITGIEQRYWDFEVDGFLLTLHLEHYLGICITPHSAGDNLF